MCRAAVAWLSSVSFPPFLLCQWSPSEKVSLCTVLGACIHQPRVWWEHATNGSYTHFWPGEGVWLLALALHLLLLPSPCQAAGAKLRLCLHLFLQQCESCLLVLSL